MLRLLKVWNTLSLFKYSNKHRISVYIQSCSTLRNDALNEKPEHIFKTEFEEKNVEISGSRSISSLLKLVTSKLDIGSAFKALTLLAQWSDSQSINYEEVEQDENYPKFVSILERGAHAQSPLQVIQALQNLKKLGFPNSNFMIESLENDLLWMIKTASIKHILIILKFQLHHQETERQKKVLEQCFRALEMRWNEITYPSDICSVYSCSAHLSHKVLSNIDDSVIKEVSDMSLNDLHRVLVAISVSNRRPASVLRSLVYHMFKKSEQLSPKQVVNVAYALNRLNFPEETLLFKLSSDFLAHIESITLSSIVGGLSLSVGQIRWRDKTLLDALGQWFLTHINECRPSDIAKLIITLAVVDYPCSNLDELLKMFIPRLDQATSKTSELVDIVWALTVLDKVTDEQIASVLQPSCFDGIDKGNSRSTGTFLKLLNINAVAKLRQSYNGPTLKFPLPENLVFTRNHKVLPIQSHLLKVLRNIHPPPKYSRKNVPTDMGFTIDAELIVDKYCRPLSLIDYSTDFGEIESIKTLPEGAQRLALMLWNFNDYTICSQSLTGQNNLSVKLLKSRGYKVVHIPHYDINTKNKLVKDVHYLERQIKETVEDQ